MLFGFTCSDECKTNPIEKFRLSFGWDEDDKSTIICSAGIDIHLPAPATKYDKVRAKNWNQESVKCLLLVANKIIMHRSNYMH